MLKSDNWIQKKSTLPTFVLQKQDLPIQEDPSVEVHKYDVFTNLSSEDIDKLIVLGQTSLIGNIVIGYRELTQEEKLFLKPLIYPFVGKKTSTLENGQKVPSFGLSSYGYDLRLGRDFKLFVKDNLRASGEEVIDICNVPDWVADNYFDQDTFVMPPHSFALGVSLERICVPRNCSVICMAKSTVSRAGVLAVVTPLESFWSGYVTIELANSTDFPIRLTSGMGIMQMMFLESDEQCMADYGQLGGKYQNQGSLPQMPM